MPVYTVETAPKATIAHVSRITSLVKDGMVEMTNGGRLRVSAAGFPLLDMVVADLAA